MDQITTRLTVPELFLKWARNSSPDLSNCQMGHDLFTASLREHKAQLKHQPLL